GVLAVSACWNARGRLAGWRSGRAGDMLAGSAAAGRRWLAGGTGAGWIDILLAGVFPDGGLAKAGWRVRYQLAGKGLAGCLEAV
ncbi:hypothetical protein, partial [Paracoccus siganidrum]|uniref:hypothetical protein n=1 Tax=Paracoccus siganidrum TaxID=1276757 RepID=UPI00197F5AD7